MRGTFKKTVVYKSVPHEIIIEFSLENYCVMAGKGVVTIPMEHLHDIDKVKEYIILAIEKDKYGDLQHIYEWDGLLDTDSKVIEIQEKERPHSGAIKNICDDDLKLGVINIWNKIEEYKTLHDPKETLIEAAKKILWEWYYKIQSK